MADYIFERFDLGALTRREAAPRDPGHGEVRVRVAAAAVNARDLAIAAGHYAGMARLPLVPLSDGAGTVEAAGPGVTELSPGDRVMSLFYPGWQGGPPSPDTHAASLGCEWPGMLAETVTLPARAFLKLPAGMDLMAAATLPCAGVTAWNALMTEGQIGPHSTVLIQGTGGVAIFALQLAAAVGARTIVISKSDEKLARARTLGASHGINYRSTPDWGKAALDLTGGRGVDVVLELGGAGTLAQSLAAVKLGGLVTMIGVLTGLDAPLSVPTMLFKHVRIQGITVGPRRDAERLLSAVNHHGIVPVIDRIVPFAAAREAFEHQASGAHFGKVVVAVDPG